MADKDTSLQALGLTCPWCLPQAKAESCVADKKTRGEFPYRVGCPRLPQTKHARVSNRRFRIAWTHHSRDTRGMPVWQFGLRIGYWPCLKAPFVSASCGPGSLEIWHGLPSYLKPRKPPENALQPDG